MDKKTVIPKNEPNKKIKPLLILNYLMKNTDENHAENANQIKGYLEECGLKVERRSIYRDIQEINLAELMLCEECDIDTARSMLEEDENDELKLIAYDKNKMGFYVKNRRYDLNDVRTLVECVYASKFIPASQVDTLLDIVCGGISYSDSESCRHNPLLTDRVRVDNRGVLYNISTINEAMSHSMDGLPHTPHKITFKYLKYSITDISKQVERRKGQRYTVSPFQLLINDGNYYLLAFDDYSQDMRTYRVDRMKEIQETDIPREGKEAFQQIDLKTYTKRVFSMFGGTQRLVTIRFINPLLDAVVDRFGRKDFQYAKVDDTHFSITGYVEISDQFFGWLLGFGNKAKLMYPADVVQDLSNYIDKIKLLYKESGG